MKWKFLCLFLLLIQKEQFAQPISLSFEHININDGLRGRYNDFIFKDSRNYVWISSTVGLHRYDGIEMKFYSPDSESGSGMLGKSIQSRFLEDSQGNIWFSTLEGIHQYDWKTDSFHAYQVLDEAEEPVNKDYNSFFLERDSLLWTVANEMIYTFDIWSKQWKSVVKSSGVRFAVDTFTNGALQTIYACPWLKRSGLEVIQIDKGISISRDIFFENGLPNSGEYQVEISGALALEQSKTWLFSDRGLLRFSYSRPDDVKVFVPPNAKTILDAIQVEEGILLVAADDGGLWIFDLRNETFITNYNYNESQRNSLVSNSYHELYLDSENHLWMASSNSAEIDHSWIYCNQMQNPLEYLGPSVKAIAEDGIQRIWCSTLNNGIFVWDKNRKLLNESQEIWNRDQDGNNLPKIYVFRADQEGEIWAIGKQFLFYFNRALNQWQIMFDAQEARLHDVIFPIDSIGVLATSKGLLSFNAFKKDKFSFQTSEIRPAGIEDLQIFHLFDVPGNLVYLPVKSSELWVYDLYNDSTTIFNLESEVHSIWQFPNDSMVWLGTLDGLMYINKHPNGGLAEVGKKDMDVQIFGVLGDDQGNLWMSTNNGIWNYHRNKNSYIKYLNKTGNQANTDKFTLFAHHKSSDGKLWFGFNKGVNVLDPLEMNPYPILPTTRMHAIQINQEMLLNPYELEHLEILNLKHYQNSIDFDVRAMSSYHNKLNTIQYRFNNETDWNSIRNGDKIELKELSPGEYELSLFASNANGLSGSVRRILIIIDEPLLKQNWFILLLLLLFLTLIYLGFKIIVNRKLRLQRLEFQRQEALKNALQLERNRIAGEMHDDLGGGLTSIRLLLKKVHGFRLPQGAIDQLAVVEKYAGELIENMSEIIWAMNSSNDNLMDLLTHVSQYAKKLFEDHDIYCAADIPKEQPQITMGGRKRRNIFLCVKECCHNILKHSNANEVNIFFVWNGMLTIEIVDNGSGFKEDELTSYGFGLSSMRERMADINGTLEIKYDNGTKVTLSIPI